jgi:DNA-binding transcriptional LysR family regulator
VNFSQLKAFYHVAKNKSFTLAAAELNVSQPTISMQVKALEKHYNVPLLRRTKKGIGLTDAGQKVFSYAKRIFSLAGELEKVLIDLDRFKSGTLRIASTRQLALYMIPGIVLKIRENYPELKLELYTDRSADIVNKLADMEYHVGVIGRVPYPDNMIYRHISKQKLYFITQDRFSDKIRLEDLSNYPIILGEKGSATRAYIIDAFAKRNIPLNNCVDAQNPSAIKHMVHLGIGGAFFPIYSIDEDVRKGKYFKLELLDDLHLNIDVVYPMERRHSRAIRIFVSIIENYPFPA